MNNDENLMREALRLARRGMQTGGGPFGAVVARDGVIVAGGMNESSPRNDPAARAEIMAIRAAGEALGRRNMGRLRSLLQLRAMSACASPRFDRKLSWMAASGGVIATAPPRRSIAFSNWPSRRDSRGGGGRAREDRAPEAAPASAFAGVLKADAANDKRTLIRALLSCAEHCNGAGDLFSPEDLLREAQTIARAEGLEKMAQEAEATLDDLARAASIA